GSSSSDGAHEPKHDFFELSRARHPERCQAILEYSAKIQAWECDPDRWERGIMISRLVTIDLILTLSLRLRQCEPLRISEKCDLDFYAAVRDILNHWARQIEEQGLSVSLETIAENAAQIFRSSKTEALWQHLTQIGDSLIEQARELEVVILNRHVGLL